MSKYTVLADIKAGVACDGTPGDELLKKVGAANFWPLNAFGVANLHGDGCRFKVKGARFCGDVAIGKNNDASYFVLLGRIRNKKFSPKRSYADVPRVMLAAVLSAALDDTLAVITE